jgi:hypothetical protein
LETEVDAPAVVGLFHPVVLLPLGFTNRLSEEDLHMIFRHEVAHLKRGDLFVNLLMSLLQILHWFNPVLWWAFARMRDDRELATDALALTASGNLGEAYGATLLKLLSNQPAGFSNNPSIGILEGKRGIQDRIERIARTKNNAYSWSAFGAILIAGLGLFTLTRAPSLTTAPSVTQAPPLQSDLRSEAPLSWETNYATALAKAKTAKRPLFAMFVQNSTPFSPDPFSDREAKKLFQDFVLARCLYQGNEEAFEKYHIGRWPVSVAVDSESEQEVSRGMGCLSPKIFLRPILEARRKLGLPLDSEMSDLEAKIFKPSRLRIDGFIANEDFNGLIKYLAPAKEDSIRKENWIIGRVSLPPGVRTDDVIVSAIWDGQDEMHQVTKEGNVLIPVRRGDALGSPVYISAPGCRRIVYDPTQDHDNAITTTCFDLKRLSEETASFMGTVLLPNGRPAPNAIVRICEWGTTRTNSRGEFRMDKVSPGDFEVRAETPGGEFDAPLTFHPGETLTRHLQLAAVTTVGIRWAVQTVIGSQQLVGAGVRYGEAYFSIKSSRFSLIRGRPFNTWGSDIMMESNSIGEPIFYLFDASWHKSGLHKETEDFDSIKWVNGGIPFDDSYFTFMQGPLVKKGDVYTVHCTGQDCYAKMEITDVTIVSNKSQQ